MKIIKRDGRAVDYDREKIRIAIEKANKEVKSKERASKEDIKGIILYIEELGKKLAVLEANYSDNPAYLALMRQKFELRKCEVEHNETSE